MLQHCTGRELLKQANCGSCFRITYQPFLVIVWFQEICRGSWYIKIINWKDSYYKHVTWPTVDPIIIALPIAIIATISKEQCKLLNIIKYTSYIMKVEEDPIYQSFISNRQITKTTQDQYRLRLQLYCNFLGKTWTELIDEAEDEEDNKIRMRNRKIKQYLLQYCEHLHQKKSSNNYIQACFMTINTIYRDNDIEVPTIRCTRKEEKELLTNQDMVTLDIIKTVMKRCNLQYKAIISLMMSSGMGSSEIRHLTKGIIYHLYV